MPKLKVTSYMNQKEKFVKVIKNILNIPLTIFLDICCSFEWHLLTKTLTQNVFNTTTNYMVSCRNCDLVLDAYGISTFGPIIIKLSLNNNKDEES